MAAASCLDHCQDNYVCGSKENKSWFPYTLQDMNFWLWKEALEMISLSWKTEDGKGFEIKIVSQSEKLSAAQFLGQRCATSCLAFRAAKTN